MRKERMKRSGHWIGVQSGGNTVGVKWLESTMTKITVTVWDKQYEITVYQKSKSVWIAVGDYEGKEIRVDGRSQSAAASHWRETARYRGN